MANKLDFFLDQGSTLLLDAEKSLEIEKILKKALPRELSVYCSAGRLQEKKLQIYSDNGAVAMKLRQISSRLLEKLQAGGLAIDSIRISVRVNRKAEPGKKKPHVMGKKGIESFRELADSLQASPLKSSIESLLEKLGDQDQSFQNIKKPEDR